MSDKEVSDRIAKSLGDYVQVKDRIAKFYELFGGGRLVTAEVLILTAPDNKQRVMVKALAYRTVDDPLPGVGYSWMELPGKTPYTNGSEIENTETSAWGRAIGSLGILIDASIATQNEIDNKADAPEAKKPPTVQSVEGGLIGIAALGKDDSPVDGQIRKTPEGFDQIGFVLGEGREKVQVVAQGELATALVPLLPSFMGERVQVYGPVTEEATFVGPKKFRRTFLRLALIQLKTADFTLPAVELGPGLAELATRNLEPPEAPSEPLGLVNDAEEAEIADLPW